MKVVINRCYGGFSLSAKAVAELAKLQGKQAYFFTTEVLGGGRWKHNPVTVDEADGPKAYMFSAFDSPDVDLSDNDEYRKHEIECRPENRADPNLVRVVEMLGDAANGKHAELEIVEIPDGTDFVVEEYDGQEWVAEAHRTWS